MKLKWKVDPPPTGRYRSFATRNWPSADFEDGRPAAWLSANLEYAPSLRGNIVPAELVIRIQVTDYSQRNIGFEWKTLTKRANTLSEAKAIVLEFFTKYPEFSQNKERETIFEDKS